MTFEDARWYVVHTYSGYENKVASNIAKVVENRKMHDRILDVRVPTEIVSELKEVTVEEDGVKVKKTKRCDVERKIFPGYVLVKLAVYYDEDEAALKMTDETWYVIRNTRGVTGFVGPESKPVPLTDEEIYALGVEKRTVQIDYAVGDQVTVVGGPFNGFPGTVESIDVDNDVVRVIISMMGKQTPIELGLDQVELPE